MKKSKKHVSLLMAATLVVVINFSSCKKYDDGPSLSLRTKKSRLAGEWEVVEINGQSQSNSGYDMIWEFEKDGDFKFTYEYGSYSYSMSGDWEFESDKEVLELQLDGDNVEFDIKRLTNKELWLEQTYPGSNQTDEWKLEAK